VNHAPIGVCARVYEGVRRAIVLAVVGFAPPVAAQPESVRVERYGAELAIGDAIAVALVGAGAAVIHHADRRENDTETLGGVLLVASGAIVYSGVGEFVHRRHGRGRGTRFTSILLRSGLPVALSFGAQYAVSGDCPDLGPCSKSDNAALVGLGAGALAAMAIDWFALARVQVVVQPASNGATVGLAAGF
jgi:hypothetical protein